MRAIEAAFKRATPDQSFSTSELVVIAYSGRVRANPRTRAKRVAVLRAADRVAARMGWHGLGGFGTEIVYANPMEHGSYIGGQQRVGGNIELPGIPNRDAPGGLWWLTVEETRARAAGDEERVREIQAEREAIRKKERTWEMAIMAQVWGR